MDKKEKLKQKIYYPHLEGKKFTLNNHKFVQCINVYIITDPVTKYKKELDHLIKETYHLNLLNISKSDPGLKKETAIRDYLKETKSGQSLYWNLNKITTQEKNKHDLFLRKTDYLNKIDKNAYYTEGCFDEKEKFIGGSKEMLNFYCYLFPSTEICTKITNKANSKSLDNIFEKVFDNTERTDLLFDKFVDRFNEDKNI